MTAVERQRLRRRVGALRRQLFSSPEWVLKTPAGRARVAELQRLRRMLR
jgi:hypothetical protein